MTIEQVQVFKSLYRQRIKKKLGSMPLKLQTDKSAAIIKALFDEKTFKSALRILVYVALPGEVNTELFIKKSIEFGKQVFVPCLNESKKVINVVRTFDPLRDLKPNKWGLLEPVLRDSSVILDPKDLDLIIVPGIVFDKNGFRIGRGYGYFDRFLKRILVP